MALFLRLLAATLCMAVWLPAPAAEPAELQWPVKRIGRLEAYPRPNDMAVTLRRAGTEWKIDQDASIYQPDVEQIWFRRDGQSGEIIVMARLPMVGQTTCSYGPGAGSNDRSIAGYTECNSAFFKCSTSVGTLLGDLPTLVTGKGTCTLQFEPEAVRQALKSAGVAEWLVSFKQDRKLKTYRESFASIRSAVDAELFIRAYQQFDPDDLVEQARQKKAVLASAEAQAEKQRELEQEARQKEQLAKADVQAKLQQEVLQRAAEKARAAEELRQKRTQDFRKKLVIGSDTFCGPVISIRSPMVQIAVNAPLPGFSAEPWLKLEEIYPAEVAGCKNVNGRLIPVFVEQ